MDALAVILPLVTAGVVVVYVGYWVFTDAVDHGLDPWVWSLVGVLLPPAGLFAYLRHRARASDELDDDNVFGFDRRQ